MARAFIAQRFFRPAVVWFSLVLIIIGLLIDSAYGQAIPAQPVPNGLHSRPLAPEPAEPQALMFQQLSAETTGVDFVYHWNPAPQYERLLNSSAVGGGVCLGDYDGDGLPDICLTRPAGGYRLYRNLGNFRFTNVTEQAGLRDDAVWSTGATFVDINNDGRLDLYICSYDGPNRLYINQGNGTFVEQAKAYGLDFNGASMMAAFGDYDRDGKLDCYLLTAGLIPKPSQRFRVKFVDGRPVVPEELQEFWQLIYQPGDRAAMAEAGQFDHLYHNNGNATFTDVSRTAGITGCDFGNAVLWWDYNGDGWPDLYVANDYFGPDHLYRNNGNGTFTDVTKDTLPHTPWTSMGADIADLNNDGLMDLVATDMAGTTHAKRIVDMGDSERSGWFLDLPEPRQYMRNAVFLNTGLNRFMEAAHLTGLANTDWTWSVLLADLDNDGWTDVFVANGMTRDWMDNDLALAAKSLPPADFMRFWRAQPVRADHNLAFKNLGALQFKNVAREWGLDHPGPSFGAALADLDGDGNLDLVINDFEAPVRIYRNQSCDSHRVKIRLAGTRSNRWGLGATVRIETDAGRQMRYLTLSHGFMSAGEPLVHFGLGRYDKINRLVVEWPSERVQSFENLPADQFYTIEEPTAPVPKPLPAKAPAPRFCPSKALAHIGHEEEAYDDFKRQPLLPYRLSQLGPGLACADVDGDGQDELYLGGSPRKPGGLYRQGNQGNYSLDSESGLAFPAHEMAPLFFDANGDGALDLYLVAGGAASEPGDESLRHRLYLNDGRGHFRPAPDGVLPDLRDSGSTVIAADFDRDGDLDLFVGGRLIPGKYPLVPNSHLLRNDRGKFVDVTDELAPGLRQAGLVTSALWSDVDNDGWPDLLLTCEWGPVKLFHNEHGRLIEQTREAGLADRLGWWNGIAGGDVNNDGNIDYVVTNFGLNTPYHPSNAEPLRVYYGDFEGNGDPQIIEAIVTPIGVQPIRGKSVLEQVLPSLRNKFPTHHSFASALLTNMFSAEALARVRSCEANTFDSGVLINNGRGQFTFHPLPWLAQIAPAFGVVLADIDGDGHWDLCLAQNFFGPQRETGRLDGGVGLILLGQGDGTFEPLWPNQSGFFLPGDGKSLIAIDLNGDGWIDLLAGVNNGELMAFENCGAHTNRILWLKLRGKPGNPTGVGSRVTVQLKSGARQTAESYAGGGYLSQSSAALVFGLGSQGILDQIEVRWPDGQTTVHQPEHVGPTMVIQQK